jgi:hypothetical protein
MSKPLLVVDHSTGDAILAFPDTGKFYRLKGEVLQDRVMSPGGLYWLTVCTGALALILWEAMTSEQYADHSPTYSQE